jgi:hypothetical protein
VLTTDETIEAVPRSEVADVYKPKTFVCPWRQYFYGWIVVGLVFAIDAVWLGSSNRSVHMGDIVPAAKTVGILLVVAAGLGGLAKIPRYKLITEKLRYTAIACTSAWLMLLLCFIPVTSILSYLCVTVNAPLVDARLVSFDRAIGFDWQSVYSWVHSHHTVQRVLELAYESGGWQLLGIPVILGLTRCYEELSRFVLHVILASILLLVFSTPFPAASAFTHFNIVDPNTAVTVSDFNLLRNGTMRSFDLGHMQGLVSIPSFHTALAVFFAYSLRRNPLFFPVALVVNLPMIISTPTQGGHYLADVFGGMLLAIITIRILGFAVGRRTVSGTSLQMSATAG